MAVQARTIQQMGQQNEQCIQHCQECHRVCVETITHSLEMSGPYTATTHIRLLLDCAEICQTAAHFMIRNSELHATLCQVCAEICLQCAEHCDRIGNDAQMKACAEACRRCAESCQLMVANATAISKV